MTGVAGCRGDVTAADTEDALALDSMLQKQVLAAQGDSVPAIEEVQEVITPLGPTPRVTASATPASSERASSEPGASEPAAAPRRAPAPEMARPSAPPARQPESPRPAPATVAAETRPAPAT